MIISFDRSWNKVYFGLSKIMKSYPFMWEIKKKRLLVRYLRNGHFLVKGDGSILIDINYKNLFNVMVDYIAHGL